MAKTTEQCRSSNLSTSVSSISSTSIGKPPSNVTQTTNNNLTQQIQVTSTNSTFENLINKAKSIYVTTPTPSIIINNSTSSFGISKGAPITMNSLTDSIFDKQKLVNNDLGQFKNLTNKMGIKPEIKEDTLKFGRRINEDGAQMNNFTIVPGSGSDLRQLAEAARAEIINTQTNSKKKEFEKLLKNETITIEATNILTVNNDVKTMECDSSVPSPKPVNLVGLPHEELDPKIKNINNQKVNLVIERGKNFFKKIFLNK